MAFTEREQKIIQWSQQNGKTVQEMKEAILRYRDTGSPRDPSKIVKPTPLERVKEISVGIAKGLGETAIGTAEILQTAGQGIIAAIDPTKTFAEIREQTGFKSLSDEGVKELLKAKTEAEKQGKVIAFAGELLAGGGASLLGKGFIKGGELARIGLTRGREILGKGVEEVIERIPEIPAPTGLLQKGKEIFERIPRALGRARETTEEAAIRAERLKTASPSVQEAIKSGLDDRLVDFTQQADIPTLRAAKEMVDISEEIRPGIKPKRQPSIVAGRVVEEQFGLIEKQRKAVGKQIEEAINKLPKTTVNMRPSINQLERVLADNGVNITKKGVLDISRSSLSKQQGSRLQELYDTATRGGDVIDAKLVHGMDRLFSQLQREARFDQLDNIFLKVNDKDVNAFQLFRGIYRNQLDNLAPEIRDLNSQYRVLRTAVDDAENSIFKTPKFEATKTTDPAEFAKVNLRRLAGEAQSSPAYQAVVENMDAMARKLGYTGAKADELIYFAQELRKLYPETIPPTGFVGGIRTGVIDIAERVLRAGEPNVKDQQKALRSMLEELLAQQ